AWMPGWPSPSGARRQETCGSGPLLSRLAGAARRPRTRYAGIVLRRDFADPGVDLGIAQQFGERDFEPRADLGKRGQFGVVFAVEQFAQRRLGDAVLVREQFQTAVTATHHEASDAFAGDFEKSQAGHSWVPEKLGEWRRQSF